MGNGGAAHENSVEKEELDAELRRTRAARNAAERRAEDAETRALAAEARAASAEDEHRNLESTSASFVNATDSSADRIAELETQTADPPRRSRSFAEGGERLARQASAAAEEAAALAAEEAADEVRAAEQAKAQRELEQARAAHLAELEALRAAFAAERDDADAMPRRWPRRGLQRRGGGGHGGRSGIGAAGAVAVSDAADVEAAVAAERERHQERIAELSDQLTTTRDLLHLSQREVASMAKTATPAAAANEEVEESGTTRRHARRRRPSSAHASELARRLLSTRRAR